MVDGTKRHGQAMKLLEEAGIYVFASVATRFSSINRAEPYKSYHEPSMKEYFQTVDMMAQYPNTLGLLAGNEVINSQSSLKCAPVIRAVIGDLKRYMKLRNEANGQRVLPIGYTHADVALLDTTVLDFLSQGDPTSSIDFWTVSSIFAFGVEVLIPCSAIVTCGQAHRTTRYPATSSSSLACKALHYQLSCPSTV